MVLDKTLNSVTGLNPISITVKGSIDIENPEIILKYNSLIYAANYMYIDTLNRYYYVEEPTLTAGGNMVIAGHIDALMSFKSDIKKAKIVCARSETEYNDYYNDSKLPIKAPLQRKMYYFPKRAFTGGHSFIMIVIST